jgi:integrase/recombinase XerD
MRCADPVARRGVAHLPRDPGPAHGRSPQDRRGAPVRKLLGKALLHPRGPRLARPSRHRGGATPQHAPHRLRHFLFTWLKSQGIDDALIQPYSGHTSRQSLEIYSKLALTDAQHTYNDAIRHFPV